MVKYNSYFIDRKVKLQEIKKQVISFAQKKIDKNLYFVEYSYKEKK